MLNMQDTIIIGASLLKANKGKVIPWLGLHWVAQCGGD